MPLAQKTLSVTEKPLGFCDCADINTAKPTQYSTAAILPMENKANNSLAVYRTSKKREKEKGENWKLQKWLVRKGRCNLLNSPFTEKSFGINK